MEFESFPKIGRLAKPCVVTEKIDGTNAQITIAGAHEIGLEGLPVNDPIAIHQETFALRYKEGNAIYAGSRNRWITPENDNYGFAKWVQANADELFKLGPGRHYGEWWGQGIQRGYGQERKRFSLFNVHRWADPNLRPACCDVVPTLYTGPFDTQEIEEVMTKLWRAGSYAAPGFMDPEGIIVYHTANGVLFKKTFDDNHKENK